MGNWEEMLGDVQCMLGSGLRGLGGGGWVNGYRGPREKSPSTGFKPALEAPLTRQPPEANMWPLSARDLAEAALLRRFFPRF